MNSETLTPVHQEILLLIHSGLNITDKIAKSLNLTPTTCRRRISELETNGYLTKVVAAQSKVLTLSSKGNQATTIISGVSEKSRGLLSKNLRVHNCRWSSAIERMPWKFHDDLVKNSFTVSQTKNWAQYINKDFGHDMTIVFNPKKVHFWVDEFFIDDPMDYYVVTERRLKLVVDELQKRFPGLVIGSPQKWFTVHSQHLAKMGGPLAKKFEAHAKATGVAEVYHGKNLDVDHSHGVWEEETKDNRLAPLHMEQLGFFFDSLLDPKNYFNPADFKRLSADVRVVRVEQNEQENAFSVGLSAVQDDIKVVRSDLWASSEAHSVAIKDVRGDTDALARSMNVMADAVMRSAVDQAKAIGSLSDAHSILSQGQAVLGNSLESLGDGQARITEILNVFGVAMHEHVTLVTELQTVTRGFEKAWQASLSQQQKFNEGQNDFNVALVGAIGELSKPWYVKFVEYVKSLIRARKQ